MFDAMKKIQDAMAFLPQIEKGWKEVKPHLITILDSFVEPMTIDISKGVEPAVADFEEEARRKREARSEACRALADMLRKSSK